MTSPGDLFWLGFTGIAAAGAAIAAAVQIGFTRADAKRQAAFAHIRDVEERLQRALHITPEDARREVLAFYRKTGPWTVDAGHYLSYLTALDLLLFACEEGAINQRLAKKWLRGHLRRDDTTLQFIMELQTACGDPACFEYLKRHLGTAWRGSLTDHASIMSEGAMKSPRDAPKSPPPDRGPPKPSPGPPPRPQPLPERKEERRFPGKAIPGPPPLKK